jgi:hypothetical protein
MFLSSSTQRATRRLAFYGMQPEYARQSIPAQDPEQAECWLKMLHDHSLNIISTNINFRLTL